MFISSYTTINFFVKKFIFSNVYISVNMIFECLYMFVGRERGHQLSTYATDGGMKVGVGGGWGFGGHPKCVELCTVGRDVMPHLYVRTCVISFHIFGSIFVL